MDFLSLLKYWQSLNKTVIANKSGHSLYEHIIECSMYL